MYILVLVALGLVFGSFVNAFAWRYKNRKDWVRGRSECTNCHHMLGVVDLIPVVSWFALRGKCRYCKARIDDSPLVELALPLLFTLSYVFWPNPINGLEAALFVVWLMILVGFLILTVMDLKWFILPDAIVFPLIGLAVIYVVLRSAQYGDWSVAISPLAGAFVISGLFLTLNQYSKGKWIGGGDVTLGFGVGLLSGGIVNSLLLLFVASTAGVLAVLPLVFKGKAHRKSHIPFGPFLVVGAVVVVLFGDKLLGWYLGVLNW